MTAPTQHWHNKPESTNTLWLTLLWLLCRTLGRAITRHTLLVLITAIYFCSDRAARLASRDYLNRLYPGKITSRLVFRHLYTFATVTMDRLFILGNRQDLFEVEIEGSHCFDNIDQGAILATAHFGSFEIMRVLGHALRDLSIHILLDKQHNAETLSFLRALNPPMADQIVDAGKPGPQLILELASLLEKNKLIGIMADRAMPGQRTEPVPFLGDDAEFPFGLWAMAIMLKRPIIYCFGTYKGGNRYRITFEKIEPATLTGTTKDKARFAMQHYAGSLEAQVREAPLNWFNFYDFWSKSGSRP